jgi:diguanylate cyclase (GGDEF)-like protein
MFRKRLEAEVATLDDGTRFAILYIDIDEFKSINDTLGHAIGDELLKVVATRLRSCVGNAGFVARLGGDEFAIVHTGIARRSDVTNLVVPLYERRQHRHRRRSRRWFRSRRIAETRGPCDVWRQSRRTTHISLLRTRNG